MSCFATDATCLGRFNGWADEKRHVMNFFDYYSSELDAKSICADGLIDQCALFRDELSRHKYDLISGTKYQAATLAQHISTIVLAPFALLIDMGRACIDKSFRAVTILKNFYMIPLHIIKSALSMIGWAAVTTHKIVSSVSTGVGTLAWHGGEWLVRQIRMCANKENKSIGSVLSAERDNRNIVYDSIGITLLAAAALCIPIPLIQLIALPIIVGSLYGTINNQFTVRTCPEYYTMGHYYDGERLGGHAIQTNNVLIKPIITGCYATTTVTKIGGVILAAAGFIPFATVTLPITLAAAMIGSVVLISLVAGHIFATMKKNKIKKSIEEYAKLAGMEITEDHKMMIWVNFQKAAEARIKELEEINGQKMSQDHKDKFRKLEEYLRTENRRYVPIKYGPGWAANNTRNGIGYLAAGVGTLAIAISTVFLRIFVL